MLTIILTIGILAIIGAFIMTAIRIVIGFCVFVTFAIALSLAHTDAKSATLEHYQHTFNVTYVSATK